MYESLIKNCWMSGRDNLGWLCVKWKNKSNGIYLFEALFFRISSVEKKKRCGSAGVVEWKMTVLIFEINMNASRFWIVLSVEKRYYLFVAKNGDILNQIVYFPLLIYRTVALFNWKIILHC